MLSRARRYEDPRAMVYHAELARAAAEHLDAVRYGRRQVADVRARVWVELGNAYRLADALDLAEGAMENALDHYEEGTRSPDLLALIADRTASLLCHRRRFPEALALLDRLYAWYRARGEDQLTGRTLITRGLYTENSGDPDSAVLMTCAGLSLIDPDRDPDLLLAGVHNLLWCATELGFYKTIARLLPLVRPLYDKQANRLNFLRLRWIEGRVALGVGDSVLAEAAFQEARAGFLEAELVFPASMVSLDLLGLLVGQERIADAGQLSEELIGSFRALRVGREAIMALILLRRACGRERVALEEVQDALRRVEGVMADLARRHQT